MPLDNTMDDKSTDFLSPVITRVLSQFGQDVSKPETQATIANVAQQLRQTNPGVDDKTIATNLASNLPSIIGSINKTQSVSTGADEVGQLADYKKQLQKDRQQSAINQVIAPVGYGTNAQANAEYNKQLQDQAYAPSAAVMAGIKADKQFYDNQNSKWQANTQAEVAAQEGIKTLGARQDQVQKTQLLDPSSPVNVALRDALKQQLRAMGVPDGSLGQMDSMNGPMMQQFAQAFTKTEREKADIGAVIASTLQTKASTTQTNAQTAQTNAQTAGINLDNRTKKVDAEISEKATEGYRNGTSAGTGSLEGAPAGTFAKYGSKGAQDTYAANTKLLDGLNAGSGDRADTLQLIDQTLQLVNQGYSGPWANRMAMISPRLQQITKNLAAMESKQQVGQSTAAGALSAQAATPDVTKDPSTLRAYLANLAATVQRQESVAQALNKARQGNGLGSFDVNKEAGNTRSFMKKNGGVATFSPDELTPEFLRQVLSMGMVPITDYHGDKGSK